MSAFVQRLRTSVTGNTMIMMALAMPALVGGTGMAVDTAQWYMWKRELQFAVDQAAMSGAYSLSKENDQNWQARAESELAANQDIVDFIDDPEISIANFGDQQNNSVVVSVQATRRLPFSGMFMAEPATVHARAQATFQEGQTYTSCLVATDLEGDGTLTIGGNASVIINCGLAALSSGANAITVNGNPTIEAGFILSAGGIDDWLEDNTEDALLENLDGLTDPFADLTPPNNPTPRNYTCTTTGRGNNRVTQASLLPGTYSTINTSCNTTLAPGIYVIDGGNLRINAQHSFTGSGVMFVLKNGASVHINGGAQVSLTAPTVSDLATMGIFDERLAGMLIFEDPNSAGSSDSIINGNSSTILNGRVYLGQSNVRIAGTARVTSQCLMIVANQIDITGTAQLGSLCPPNQQITPSLGEARSRVYLVS